jgi:hypothetical protein
METHRRDLLSPMFAEGGFEEAWEGSGKMLPISRLTDAPIRGGTHTHGVVVWQER